MEWKQMKCNGKKIEHKQHNRIETEQNRSRAWQDYTGNRQHCNSRGSI